MKRRNPPRSVKQVLVRDFNWRMGNLRRLQMNVRVMTGGRDHIAEKLVMEEIGAQIALHKNRLWCAEHNIDIPGDLVYWAAQLAVERGKHELEMALAEKARNSSGSSVPRA